MPSFDKIAEYLALTNALGAGTFRDSQAKAMQLATVQNAMAMPSELALLQSQASLAPALGQAQVNRYNADTEAQTLANITEQAKALSNGLRDPLTARGFNFDGFPQPLSPEQAVQAFEMVTQGQQLPPEILEALRYDPKIGRLLLGLGDPSNQPQFQVPQQ